jgi:hypothetical protein
MDVWRQEDQCFAGSAQFEHVLNRRDFKAVMNAPISPVLLLTSLQCLGAKRSFCERSRIGGPTERNNGYWLKKSDIDVLNVDKNCLEEPNGVITANLQWMWIDPGWKMRGRFTKKRWLFRDQAG